MGEGSRGPRVAAGLSALGLAAPPPWLANPREQHKVCVRVRVCVCVGGGGGGYTHD